MADSKPPKHPNRKTAESARASQAPTNDFEFQKDWFAHDARIRRRRWPKPKTCGASANTNRLCRQTWAWGKSVLLLRAGHGRRLLEAVAAAKFLAEALHAPSRVDKLLLAREKWMACAANVHTDFRHCASSGEVIAASAVNRAGPITRMNLLFHNKLLKSERALGQNKPNVSRTTIHSANPPKRQPKPADLVKNVPKSQRLANRWPSPQSPHTRTRATRFLYWICRDNMAHVTKRPSRQTTS